MRPLYEGKRISYFVGVPCLGGHQQRHFPIKNSRSNGSLNSDEHCSSTIVKQLARGAIRNDTA